jgi:hypothetical protein
MNDKPSLPVQPKQKSKLALLSLIFSSCTVIIPYYFVGTIVGIICGHLAMRELKHNPQLEGRRMAKWGLIIGYASFVIIPLLILGVLFMMGR